MGWPPIVPFGPKKFLWGNMPALDILKLGDNEGEGDQGSLKMLFAGESFSDSSSFIFYSDR